MVRGRHAAVPATPKQPSFPITVLSLSRQSYMLGCSDQISRLDRSFRRTISQQSASCNRPVRIQTFLLSFSMAVPCLGNRYEYVLAARCHGVICFPYLLHDGTKPSEIPCHRYHFKYHTGDDLIEYHDTIWLKRLDCTFPLAKIRAKLVSHC